MDCTAIILTIGIIFAASFFYTVSGFGFASVYVAAEVFRNISVEHRA